MERSKMTTCKHCGAEIAASAKVCPHCGGKNKPPIYKRWCYYCDRCSIRYWRLWKQFWRFEQQQSDLDENEWCVYCIVD